MATPCPTPAPEVVAATGTPPGAANISLILFPVSCPRARSSCISFHPKAPQCCGAQALGKQTSALP